MRDDRLQCVCGAKYFPRQSWAHEGCASNARASNADAPVVHAAPKKQRWDRDKFNGYQRELMRKRRLEGKA